MRKCEQEGEKRIKKRKKSGRRRGEVEVKE